VNTVYAQLKIKFEMNELINKELLNSIITIIENAKEKAIRSVDHERTLLYWHIGKHIIEDE
jgi:hypothetical protein